MSEDTPSVGINGFSGGKGIGIGVAGSGHVIAETVVVHNSYTITGSASVPRPPAPVRAGGAARVFFSYAAEDEPHRITLEKHLRLLQRQGLVEGWHARMVAPGEERDAEVRRHLDAADVVLLLVSPDFLACDRVWEEEMARALERHDAREASVVPVFVRPCDWRGAPFARLQGLPRDGEPVTRRADADEAWTEVAAGLRALVEQVPR
jgi:hypothetical protein